MTGKNDRPMQTSDERQFNKTLLRKMPCSVLFLKSEPRAVPEEEEENAEEEAA